MNNHKKTQKSRKRIKIKYEIVTEETILAALYILFSYAG